MFTNTLFLFYIFDMSLSYLYNETYKVPINALSPRVVNGWPANLGDVPYQVAFKRSIRKPMNKYATFCGGVIIAPAKLLSAAHCFTDKPSLADKMCGGTGHASQKVLSHTYAVAGQLSNHAIYHFKDSPSDGQWRRLKKVRYPPKYNFPKLDIAIVFLMTPFVYDNYVNSIPYARKYVDYSGKCLVSGFGRISNRYNSDKLLLAHLTVLPLRLCNKMHRKNMHLFVCTSSQYTDVGKGDSGGPLVCSHTGDPNESSKGVLVGIVSGHAYHIGSFFTRVSSYYHYIERNKSSPAKMANVISVLLLNLIQWKVLLF
ncbi:venom peptide isomerase heavy chain-like [Epargyreus clarus]|uniref:venom peptide isomerase heavy chain-like n=1 Tax=Epargyreus clarus TaxID=520877 RepID=UPI003C2B8BAF